MSEDCSIYTCDTGNKGLLTTSDSRVYTAKHEWYLSLAVGAISLCNVARSFEIKTQFSTTATADKIVLDGGLTRACNLNTSGGLTPALTESISGNMAMIMYADLENDVYLLKRIAETNDISSTYQNPFEYVVPYGSAQSVAYFPTLARTRTITFELWMRGQLETTLPENPVPVTTNIALQALVWPVPESDASFYLGVPAYDWLNSNFFYWYNDPADVGVAPCYTGPIGGGGEGMLTGYSKAVADGGKDFFYPTWIRSYVFTGCRPFHSLMQQEATERFYNLLGGTISDTCAAPFSRPVDAGLWISQDVVGNYLRMSELDFYSFYLPEIGRAIVNLGNEEIKSKFDAAFKDVDGNTLTASSYYPVGVI